MQIHSTTGYANIPVCTNDGLHTKHLNEWSIFASTKLIYRYQGTPCMHLNGTFLNMKPANTILSKADGEVLSITRYLKSLHLASCTPQYWTSLAKLAEPSLNMTSSSSS